jgi:2-(1,2-epoxy-1,2-dihydrophenyl)acetyl-CoA isomerase
MGEFLSVERRGKIAILTMIKPESMNAIGTHEDCQDIINTLCALGDDRGVSAIILTGSGKAFSAGGNLKAGRTAPGSACSTSPTPPAPITARACRR